ncbi:MAG: amidohydrolase family protein [Planctomycetota bacterium]
MKDKNGLSRRASMKSMGALGAAAFLGAQTGGKSAASKDQSAQLPASEVREQIEDKVWKTSFVDTHEHLVEEELRLNPDAMPFIQCHDWSQLVAGYLFSDLLTSGLPLPKNLPWYKHDLFSTNVDPAKKWSIIAPYWPAVKNTGYGQALRLSLKELYGVTDLSADTIEAIQEGYKKTVSPGFYKRILCDEARIESCQVNSFAGPFCKSDQPLLLMQDMNVIGMILHEVFPEAKGWSPEAYSGPTGIDVKSLADWHKVIDWWFRKYERFAVAAKSQHAYFRGIDHPRVPATQVEDAFEKNLENKPVTSEEKKALEDHLFWYVVKKATEHSLPVKIHTGYHAGENKMPLSRLMSNPGSACDLCRNSPDTAFVFMHICYPYYEELIALAKHYTNAYIDMCWAWICNPIASKDFLKKYLVTAPANKVLTFGADYVCVENVVGHAIMARQGITQALTELVEEGWFSLSDAMELIDPIMHGNARELFRLKQKEQALKQAPWS